MDGVDEGSYEMHDVISSIKFLDIDELQIILEDPKIIAELKKQSSSNEPTALSVACMNGLWQYAEVLLKAGLSPNQANSSGQRPLMCAKTVDCLVQLVKYGADVNATNRKGRTALMQACINGNVPCIEYLLRQGANPNMTDSGGRSALMLAVRGRHDNVLPCVKLLVQYNANVQHMDKYHVSAFDLTDRNDVKEALLNESLIRASHQANEGLNGTNVNISRINNPMIKDQAQNSNREIIEAFQQLGLTSESPVSDGRTRSYSSDSSISEVTEPTVAISPTIRSTGIFSFFLGRNA